MKCALSHQSDNLHPPSAVIISALSRTIYACTCSSKLKNLFFFFLLLLFLPLLLLRLIIIANNKINFNSCTHELILYTFKALDDAIKRAKAEEITIPFGVGIAGHVAETKEMVNIKEAYNDPRFNCEIDLKTGYKTNNILSLPICNYEGDVIGVAQIINKTNGMWKMAYT